MGSHRSDNDRRGPKDDDYNDRRGNRGRREEEGDSWRRREDGRSRRRSPEPFRRSPGASRRSQEVVKSAADRRMERELGSAIVKNPFDPSNRIGRSRMNRLDEEDFDQPCMNPEAPDPPAATTGGPSGNSTGGPSGDSKDKEAGGATDYAALLQYLQFYQKQMEDKQ